MLSEQWVAPAGLGEGDEWATLNPGMLVNKLLGMEYWIKILKPLGQPLPQGAIGQVWLAEVPETLI